MSNVHLCSHCAMSEICLPLGVDKAGLVQIEKIIDASAVMHSGDMVLRQGDVFNKLYAVKSGMCKSYRVDEEGNEHVVGFHLPGELFGLDAIYSQSYGCTVEALDTVVLCEMDYDELTGLCSEIPTLQRQLLRLLSRDLHVSHTALAAHVDYTAEQKLADFINNLANRFEARGHSATEFNLSMSRRDIASHLGLAPETVSRLLKRFQEKGALAIDNRSVQILDKTRLKELIDCHGLSPNNIDSKLTASSTV